MSSRTEFSPEQLDRLEDALEGLEDELFEPVADDPVDERLVEFREILQLSREALPMEDVPSGLLDGVMAEARQAAANDAPKAAAASWWSRLTGGAWLPTLAFAGSAALLLVMLWPTGSDEEAEPSVAAATPNDKADPAPPAAAKPVDARVADASSSKAEGDAFGFEQAQRGRGVVGGLAAPEPEPAADAKLEAEPEAPEEDEEAPAEELTKEVDAPTPAKRAATKKGKSAGGVPGGIPGGVPGSGGKGNRYPSSPTPEPAPKPKPKGKKDTGQSLMDAINLGDRERRGGRCGLAEMHYGNARKTGDDRVRARALAGLGLCKELEGAMGPAKKLYAQARAADPSVGSFISREQARMRPDPEGADEVAEEQAYDDAPQEAPVKE